MVIVQIREMRYQVAYSMFIADPKLSVTDYDHFFGVIDISNLQVTLLYPFLELFGGVHSKKTFANIELLIITNLY